MSDVLVASGEPLTMPMSISLPLSLSLFLSHRGREKERINIHADSVTEPRAYCLTQFTLVSFANHDLMALLSSAVCLNL